MPPLQHSQMILLTKDPVSLLVWGGLDSHKYITNNHMYQFTQKSRRGAGGISFDLTVCKERPGAEAGAGSQTEAADAQPSQQGTVPSG